MAAVAGDAATAFVLQHQVLPPQAVRFEPGKVSIVQSQHRASPKYIFGDREGCMLRIGDLLARRRRHGTAQPYDVIQMRSG